MTTQMTIEDLAEMIQRTMASKEDLKVFATKDDLKNLEQRMDEKFEHIHKKFEHIDGRFDHVDARLDTIEHDVSDLPAMRQEFIDTDERLTKVELKVTHA